VKFFKNGGKKKGGGGGVLSKNGRISGEGGRNLHTTSKKKEERSDRNLNWALEFFFLEKDRRYLKPGKSRMRKGAHWFKGRKKIIGRGRHDENTPVARERKSYERLKRKKSSSSGGGKKKRGVQILL